MRRMVWIVLSPVVVAWVLPAPRATAQQPRPAQGASGPAAAPARPAADPLAMKKLLQGWEKQSTLLKTLDVKLSRIDSDPAWGPDERYEGRALFSSPNLAWLNFQKVVVDKENKTSLVQYERIVCTGSEVWQYKSETKQIFVYELDPQARNRALQQGPLPFLFNFNARDAEQRYDMTLEGQDAKSYIVKVVPKIEIDKEAFDEATIQLDRRYLLPTRIHLLGVGRKGSKTFTLTNIEPNKKVAPENFKGQLLPAPWKMVRNAELGAPDAAAARAPQANPNLPPPRRAALQPPAPTSRPRVGR